MLNHFIVIYLIKLFKTKAIITISSPTLQSKIVKALLLILNNKIRSSKSLIIKLLLIYIVKCIEFFFLKKYIIFNLKKLNIILLKQLYSTTFFISTIVILI